MPERPQVKGKFIFQSGKKLDIQGITYGTFQPDEKGNEYSDLEKIDRDFELMTQNNINCVRVYTSPPRIVLDIAFKHKLYVMVGLVAQQYLGYLIDNKKTIAEIKVLIREKASICANHPALLCYDLANEIPSSLVRWLGHHKIENYLKELYWAIKEEDNQALVTYVNYPTTEYLKLPFLDFVSFNVYWENQDKLTAYLNRLQNLSDDRPLVMTELGLDSLRNGEEKQAQTLQWQINTAFKAGCAGAFVYAWTDEWFRGGREITDWAFGITTKDRQPKLSLNIVKQSFAEIPFALPAFPNISVVICTYNGSKTIHDSLDALEKLNYPNYEVIVINDGSNDNTPEIVKQYKYDIKLISTENRGLSAARNTGWQTATGEIIAYLDDDAYPDPDWLSYLAQSFVEHDFVAVGGPNLPPGDDGFIADCVAHSPGGPIPVLISDNIAEHITGCNMAFRKDCLQAREIIR